MASCCYLFIVSHSHLLQVVNVDTPVTIEESLGVVKTHCIVQFLHENILAFLLDSVFF